MIDKNYVINRSWTEIDLSALAHNARQIKALTGPTCEIMGIVKADAYGHGACEVAPVLLNNGFTRLAVSLLDEAIALRKSGITAPILILSYTDPRRAEEIIRYRVTQTVYTWDLIDALEAAGQRLKAYPSVHIKVDTGMSRIGFTSGFSSVEEIEKIHALKNVFIEGIFTHFSTADEADRIFFDKQAQRFMGICNELESEGIYIPIKHCCNSAALMRYPEYHLDMVRAGIVTYGILPDFCESFVDQFRPAMSIKSNVIMVKHIPAGTAVSYNRRYIAPSERTLATVPIGYADGYSRVMSGKAEALIHGMRVPVVGNICMDACMMDVTDIPETVEIGDEVVLCGSQNYGDRQEFIAMEELADWHLTITYEVMSTVGKRMPRVYVDGGRIIDIHSDILDSGL
ncbi:MAG: alanine racemase [Fastidiosipilaceae bacterium]|jgi:alanine racemase|nr:alanine racemase [Clostridiaceae bacterium]